MALQEVINYSFESNFMLSKIAFDKACIANKTEQINAYNIYWIKDGKGEYQIDFKNYLFEGNTLLFLTPGQIFSVLSENIKTAYKLSFQKDFYCIETHDAAISCNGVLFNNIYEAPSVIPSDRDVVKLDFILESLIEEFTTSGAAQYDMLQSLLKQFIIHSVRIKNEVNDIVDINETKLFKDFSLLIEQNYKEIHSVTTYAERLGVSPKSLTKHLQKIGTLTPSALIKERILLEAKRMLIYTSSTVKEIAYDLGFNDPAYFTRFFTKSAQKSPSQFKNDHGKAS